MTKKTKPSKKPDQESPATVRLPEITKARITALTAKMEGHKDLGGYKASNSRTIKMALEEGLARLEKKYR